jgi:hypothetical protein
VTGERGVPSVYEVGGDQLRVFAGRGFSLPDDEESPPPQPDPRKHMIRSARSDDRKVEVDCCGFTDYPFPADRRGKWRTKL